MKITDSGMQSQDERVRFYALADEVLQYGDMEKVMESHGLETRQWKHPVITDIRDTGIEWRTEWECVRRMQDEDLQSGDDRSCGQSGGQ